jgi:hypothetical protein
MKSVEVHNNQGKIICKIETPPTLKDIILSPLPISHEWKNPNAVEVWAWRTAHSILTWVQADISDRWYMGLSRFGALCPACWKFSIIPVSKQAGRFWFSCFTQGCPMQQVVIHKNLVDEAADDRLEFSETSIDDPIMKLLILFYARVKASIQLGIEPNREEVEQSLGEQLKEFKPLP